MAAIILEIPKQQTYQMKKEEVKRLFKEDDYIFKDNIVYRRIGSPNISVLYMNIMLRICLEHFTKEVYYNDLQIINAFITKDNGPKSCDGFHNCCCAHAIDKYWQIFHKKTGITFYIGSVCFAGLFEDPVEGARFFKAKCNLCDNKCLAHGKNKFMKEGFCSAKCLEIQVLADRAIQQEIDMKKFREARAAELKKWEDERPEREAAREAEMIISKQKEEKNLIKMKEKKDAENNERQALIKQKKAIICIDCNSFVILKPGRFGPRCVPCYIDMKKHQN